MGMEFHYSWLIILIALIRWKDPSYSYFRDRIGHCHTAQYTSMGITLDPKKISGNADTFDGYLSDIQGNKPIPRG
jgi:hypothetical protein